MSPDGPHRFSKQPPRVGLSKEQIKNAPEFDETTYRDDEYRSSLGDYYAPYLTR
jgi:hypothetical protein